jgi:hypothetical protein
LLVSQRSAGHQASGEERRECCLHSLLYGCMYVWMDRQLRFRTPKTQQPSHSNRRSTRCFQSIVHTENMPDQPIYTIAVRALCEFNAKRGDLDRFVEARMAVSVTHETESSATGTSAINPSQSTCHCDSRCRVPPPSRDDSCRRLSLPRSLVQGI